MVTVILERLLKSAQLDLNYGIEWNRKSPINLNRIKNAIENGIGETNEGFGDGWNYLIKGDKDDNYHLSRILYFINHREEINGIEVDNRILADRYSYSVLPNAKITDGHHRLLAVAFLGLEKIQIRYSGRTDVLSYLTGENETEPKEII